MRLRRQKAIYTTPEMKTLTSPVYAGSAIAAALPLWSGDARIVNGYAGENARLRKIAHRKRGSQILVLTKQNLGEK